MSQGDDTHLKCRWCRFTVALGDADLAWSVLRQHVMLRHADELPSEMLEEDRNRISDEARLEGWLEEQGVDEEGEDDAD